jgi:DNA-binding NarL/FixJ family response regulator
MEKPMADDTPVILVIDDEAAHRMLIKRAIKALYSHAQISEAENISAAKRLVTEISPYIITLDLSLGRESGFDFLTWLRQPPVSSSTPVVVVTTSQLPSDISLAQQLGATEYISKDSDITRNTQTIQSALSKYLPPKSLPPKSQRPR